MSDAEPIDAVLAFVRKHHARPLAAEDEARLKGLCAAFLLARRRKGLPAVEYDGFPPWDAYPRYGDCRIPYLHHASARRRVITLYLVPEWEQAMEQLRVLAGAPASVWEFRPGRFTYGGREYRLTGQSLELLEAFVFAKDMTLANDEINHICGRGLTQREHGYVSELNKKLRDLWGLGDNPITPIPRAKCYRLQPPPLPSESSEAGRRTSGDAPVRMKP